ncbi:GNAT family protein [Erysipelotrichaceae bacterium HCN-30851]
MNPYIKCPKFENENFILRLVHKKDTSDLLLVYSDEYAVPYFNSDNCDGDNFYYVSINQMKQAIEYWQFEYNRRGFVRWTIIDKNINHAIGTIELFNRKSNDYFHNCGLLRLDLRSDYEKANVIYEILSLIIKDAFDLFSCSKIATKVPSFANERKKAVRGLGFQESKEKLIGDNDHQAYQDYYILEKENCDSYE